MTSKPLVRRTLATLRKAEFGFFGVVVYTRVQTPRFCGQLSSAGTLLLVTICWRPLRTNWLIVGIAVVPKNDFSKNYGMAKYATPEKRSILLIRNAGVKPFRRLRRFPRLPLPQ